MSSSTSKSSGYSVMQEITKIEGEIKGTYERLETLEKKLKNENLPEVQQKAVERELEEVRKLLRTHEEQLAHLRTHNRKSFVFVVALIFIIFTVYMLYVLVGGSTF
ncbi:unnamed protein product [Phaedon cochleariae]|uniref:Coiled-coil domain-containing protein 167 n=1 Tax=Phaedon cochleariae TaxID=80249 RepID=A0A9P0DRN4_PHACE|nr:unnamed protein product [Phaedon cochleariae]